LAGIVDARRIDRLEGRVGNVEKGLVVLADEFNGWTILPAHRPMGFGVSEKGE